MLFSGMWWAENVLNAIQHFWIETELVTRKRNFWDSFEFLGIFPFSYAQLPRISCATVELLQ